MHRTLCAKQDKDCSRFTREYDRVLIFIQCGNPLPFTVSQRIFRPPWLKRRSRVRKRRRILAAGEPDASVRILAIWRQAKCTSFFLRRSFLTSPIFYLLFMLAVKLDGKRGVAANRCAH